MLGREICLQGNLTLCFFDSKNIILQKDKSQVNYILVSVYGSLQKM
jgi:hypothetical protein